MAAQNPGLDFEETREKLKALSVWIFVLLLPLLAASVYSWPFPFVRQLWMKETIGLTGLVNAFFFGWISMRMKQMHLQPIIAGIGLFLNEMLLTIYGFWFSKSLGYGGKRDLVFCVVSVGMGFFYLGLLLSAAKVVVQYKKWFYNKGPGVEKEKHPEEILPLMISLVVYALLFIGAWQSKIFPWAVSVALLKGIGQGASFFAFLGIGYEIHFYLRNEENLLQCCIKGLSHALALAIILVLVYHRLPLESMVKI